MTSGPERGKTCRKCRRRLPIGQFYGGSSPCKDCHNAGMRAYRKRIQQEAEAYRRLQQQEDHQDPEQKGST